MQKAFGGPTAGGGRFFDQHGRYRGQPQIQRVGQSGERYGAFGPDIFRLSLPLSEREETERPFEENPWVRSAIKAISSGFQRLTFRLYDRDPQDEDAKEIEKHPLLDLLASPNQLMTERAFWRAHAVGMKHDGEMVWFFADKEGQPIECVEGTRDLKEFPAQIIPVRGKLVEIQHDAAGWPISYRYTTAYGKSSNVVSPAFPTGSVAHFRDYDPYNVTRGLGDVDGLQREIDLYFQAFRAMDATVRNGGDPGGFLSYDGYVQPEELDRRQEIADDEFSGPNRSRVKVLGDGAKFYPSNIKPSDMQYRELVEWLRDSILAGLGVPIQVITDGTTSTYNNVETAHREMWTGPNGILSLAESAADVITHDVLPRLMRASKLGQPDIYAAFDSSAIEALREDQGEKITRAAELAAKGIGLSFNELLQLQGVQGEGSEEGDRRFVSSSLAEAGAEVEGEGEEDTGSDATADPTSTLNGAQIASLLTVIEQVRSGAITKDTATQILVASFPFDEARITRLLRDVEEGEAEETEEESDENMDEENGDTDDSDDEGSDASGEDGEADESGDDSGELARSARGVAFANDPGRAPDAKLMGKIESWLNRYAAATVTHLRKVSNNGLRRFSVLDDTTNPAALTDEAFDALVLSSVEWAAKLDRETRVALREIWQRSFDEAHGLVGGDLVSITDPGTVREMSLQRIQLAEGVTSTVAKRVRKNILKVLTKQAPPGSLREMVKAVLPELTDELKKAFKNNDARAATIAQTETGRAENGATFRQFEETGVEEIEWVASVDDATRASHVGVHGTTVRMGGAFDNGLRYPHDPNASAGEVVNCRCKIRAVSIRNPFDDIDDDSLPDDL